MPLYEYSCQACGDRFELLVRSAEKPACPECGSARLERHLGVPAAHVAKGGSLPVCEPRSSAGGCGAPWCSPGGCQ
ncbi:MAG: zinc ribbon domain-containing protein [Planctomycetia bacterium]|nr:zinc ribbon domain-containing protein [Planctomycetia bacterium]